MSAVSCNWSENSFGRAFLQFMFVDSPLFFLKGQVMRTKGPNRYFIGNDAWNEEAATEREKKSQ